jgi:hypothetical protein
MDMPCLQMQVVLNNKQVYHLSKSTIELDVNTYLTIDPKVRSPCQSVSSVILVLNLCDMCNPGRVILSFSHSRMTFTLVSPDIPAP